MLKIEDDINCKRNKCFNCFSWHHEPEIWLLDVRGQLVRVGENARFIWLRDGNVFQEVSWKYPGKRARSRSALHTGRNISKAARGRSSGSNSSICGCSRQKALFHYLSIFFFLSCDHSPTLSLSLSSLFLLSVTGLVSSLCLASLLSLFIFVARSITLPLTRSFIYTCTVVWSHPLSSTHVYFI